MAFPSVLNVWVGGGQFPSLPRTPMHMCQGRSAMRRPARMHVIPHRFGIKKNAGGKVRINEKKMCWHIL